jgi:UDP-N-acetylmuramoyl-tripeptide--D-alanyl-D-alanine ligase
LTGFTPVKGRSQVRPLRVHGQPRTLIDDTYNANPDSVRAAIDVLAELPRPRWLVLGDMGEVGDQGPAFHAEIGAYARAQGIETVWCAGALMRHAADAAQARHFASADELLAALDEAPPYASVLVKGSRFMKMERVVAALQSGDARSGGNHAA